MGNMDNYLDVDLFGESKDSRSILIIQQFEPPEGYWLAFSGGKDSIVLKDLTIRANVKFESHYSRTGIDPPELTKYIKTYHKDVIWDKPKMTFFEGIKKKGLPTRVMRWCCDILKEYSGEERLVLTGVRAEESNKRSTYGIVRPCLRGKGKTFINPILQWTEHDIWKYIRKRELPYCSLYDEGFKRIGCICCPFERNIERSMQRWPKLWEALKKSIEKFYPEKECWHKFGSPIEYFNWWIKRDQSIDIENIQLFDD